VRPPRLYALLPEALRAGNPLGLPRLVDGEMRG
jgi:hypothetical protein